MHLSLLAESEWCYLGLVNHQTIKVVSYAII